MRLDTRKILSILNFVFILFLCFWSWGCDQEPKEETQNLSSPKVSTINSIETLRTAIENQANVSPQALSFVLSCNLTQKREILNFCFDSNPKLIKRTQDLLSIVVLKDLSFQEQIILLLDSEQQELRSVGESIITKSGGALFKSASKTAPKLSLLGRTRLIGCFQNLKDSLLLEEIQEHLSSNNPQDQDFALDCLLRNRVLTVQNILENHLKSTRIGKKIALKLAYLENAKGANLLIDSLSSEDPKWNLEVGKAFFKLGKKGIPALRRGLSLEELDKVKEVLNIQFVLKHQELLLALLPLLKKEELKEKVYSCLCVATREDAKMDLEAWRKIILKK